MQACRTRAPAPPSGRWPGRRLGCGCECACPPSWHTGCKHSCLERSGGGSGAAGAGEEGGAWRREGPLAACTPAAGTDACRHGSSSIPGAFPTPAHRCYPLPCNIRAFQASAAAGCPHLQAVRSGGACHPPRLPPPVRHGAVRCGCPALGPLGLAGWQCSSMPVRTWFGCPHACLARPSGTPWLMPGRCCQPALLPAVRRARPLGLYSPAPSCALRSIPSTLSSVQPPWPAARAMPASTTPPSPTAPPRQGLLASLLVLA